jgi:ribosomal protein S18 acetylase RimI-like enzyme
MNIKEFTMSDYNAAHSLWWNTKGVCNCDKCMFLDSKEQIEKFLARNPNTSFIAEENGELIGTVLCGNDGRVGTIYRLTVSEKTRKRGIGKALVEKAAAALKNEGITSIRMFALKDNEGANAFWERLGFKKMDEAIARSIIISQG